MSQPPGTALMGRLAVHLKMISLEQLAEATREQSKGDPPKRLGDILIDKGFITQKQLAKLVQAQQQVIAKQRSQAAAAKPPAAATSPDPAPAPAPSAPAAARAPAARPTAPARRHSRRQRIHFRRLSVRSARGRAGRAGRAALDLPSSVILRPARDEADPRQPG
jgi:pyruvate/2-oxoglutarate dehydrogenase complex dihydrolipoamide acyltransferase (E2) component